MPVRDYSCPACNKVEEDVYMRHCDDPPPPCPACGGERKQLISRFGLVFMGSLRKYADPTREGGRQDGFWAHRRHTKSGEAPEAVYLDSVQAVREFNKAEGLTAPGEIPSNSTISADGKEIKSTGMPGQWQGGCCLDLIPSRLWEMDTALTSPRGKEPSGPGSGPPCTVEVADAATMAQFAAQSPAG